MLFSSRTLALIQFGNSYSRWYPLGLRNQYPVLSSPIPTAVVYDFHPVIFTYTNNFSMDVTTTTDSPTNSFSQHGDGRNSLLYNIEFEVHGEVQGVFFRKYTQKRANELGLVGWVKNTPHNTVAGQIQGSKDAVDKMKHWLKYTGSPQSTIARCDFKNEKPISKKDFSSFDVRH